MRRVSSQALIAGGAGVAVALAVFAENLFGRQIQAVFLAYPGIDKVLHFVEYAGIFFVARWVVSFSPLPPAWHGPAAWLGTLALSIADEALQQFGPGRSVEVLDVAANLAGCTFALACTMVGVRGVALAAAAVVAGAVLSYDTHVKLRDYAKGLQYERTHRFALARVHYHKALASGLRTPALYNGLSWVEVESGEGDPKRAVEFGSMAVSLQPRNADYLDTYGWALHNAGRSEEALEPLRRAYAAKPDMYCVNYHLGAVYLALGRRDLAEAHFRRQVTMANTREARLAASALAGMETHR